MQQDELRSLLTAITADRVALIQRHEAGARVVSHYDFNNAYQYVIAREETHLSWLRSALEELSLPMPSAASEIPVPPVPKAAKNADAAAYHDILTDDARHLAAFVERWRPKVATVTHARHRTMLGVLLGESVEHQRLFEQAASGMEDVIGKRTTRRRARRRRVARALAGVNDHPGRDRAWQQHRRSRSLSARRARCAAPIHPVSSRLEFLRHRSRRRRRPAHLPQRRRSRGDVAVGPRSARHSARHREAIGPRATVSWCPSYARSGFDPVRRRHHRFG